MAGKRILVALIVVVAAICALTSSRRTFVPLVQMPQVSRVPAPIAAMEQGAYSVPRVPAPFMVVKERPNAIPAPKTEPKEEAPFMILFAPYPEDFEMSQGFMKEVRDNAMTYRKEGEVQTPQLNFVRRGQHFYGRVFVSGVKSKLNGAKLSDKEVVVGESFKGTAVATVDIPLQEKGDCQTNVGFTMREINSDHGRRLEVASVSPGSAAEASGLETGDLLRGVTVMQVGFDKKETSGLFGTKWFKFLPLYERSYRSTDSKSVAAVQGWLPTNLFCRGGTDVLGLVVERRFA
jgi:hypothetical protein